MTTEDKVIERSALLDLLRSIKEMMQENQQFPDSEGFVVSEPPLSDDRPDIYRPLDKMIFRLESGYGIKSEGKAS